MVLSVNNEPPKKQHKMQQSGEADRANEQTEQLLDRIHAYHRHIDECTAEMTDWERRIDECRALVTSQQELIRKKREAVILRQLGTRERERQCQCK